MTTTRTTPTTRTGSRPGRGAAPREGASRRLHLLQRLYGERLSPEALTEVADALEGLLEAAPRPTPTRVLDETDVWLIAYPDHVVDGTGARPPLAALADLVDRHLSPVVTGVHTLPLHPSSSDGGFAVMDHHAVDPAYGAERDVRRLAAGATWMADAVVNHVSAQGTWVRRWLAGDPALDGVVRTLDADVDTRRVVRPRTSPLRTVLRRPDGSEVGVWTTFSADQVDLDYDEPRTLLLMVDVLLGYVALGARAIRLDAVGFAWKDPATTSLNLPGAHALVQLLRACLDAVDPGLVLVTETNVPHEENVAYLGLDGEREAQAVYQFALPPLVLHALLSADATALKRWARQLWFPTAGGTYLNFLASHDGIGVRAVEGLLDEPALRLLVEATEAAGGVVNERALADGTTRPYELATTWASVVGAGHDEDAALRRHLATHAVALALRGVPLLYLGSLLAAENDTARLAATGHARDLNRTRFDADDLDLLLTTPGSRQERSLAGIGEMLLLRRAHTAFAPEAEQVVHGEDPRLVVVERVPEHGCRAAVAVNVAGEPVPLELPAGRWARVDSGADRAGAAQSAGELLLAWEHAWFVEVR